MRISRGLAPIVAAGVLALTMVAAPCAGVAASAGGRPEAEFQRAGGLYDRERYAEAAAIYERLIETGHASGPIYFNLGNCYFKQNRLGEAILAYERARRLMPGDPSLKANYDFALKTAGVDNRPRTWIGRVRYFISSRFTGSALAIMAVASFLLCLAALNLIFWFRHRSVAGTADRPRWAATLRPALAVLTAVTILIGAAAAWVIYDQDVRVHAVVIASAAEVCYEPNQASTVYYRLKEGSMVEIGRRDGSWVLIESPDGKRGWVESRRLAKI